ncbi:hypothetical protein [Pectobacterium aroidearum]|nr:hypothetical protein [Pectobacterium aroidearum]
MEIESIFGHRSEVEEAISESMKDDVGDDFFDLAITDDEFNSTPVVLER